MVRVLLRAQYIPALPADRSNFLYVHERYADPAEVVLRSDRVTLMDLDREWAIFCVSDPEDDVCDTRKYPFMFLSQFARARRLVLLPARFLHRLAEEAGDPSARVAVINMTARCGSTLCSQLFNRVPSVRSMSEPFALLDIHHMYRTGRIGREENARLVRSAMRLLCRTADADGGATSVVLVKLPAFCSPQAEIIADQMPEARLFFNTRHPRPSLESFLKIVTFLRSSLYFRLGWNWRYLAERFPYPYDRGQRYEAVYGSLNRKRQEISFEELGALNYAGAFATYLENRDIYSQVILYERLREDPEGSLRRLFRELDLPEEHLPAALAATRFDSQGATFASGETRVDGRVRRPEAWKKVDNIFARMRLPFTVDSSEEEFLLQFTTD